MNKFLMGTAVLMLSSITSYAQKKVGDTVEDKNSGVIYVVTDTKVEKTTTKVTSQTEALTLNFKFDHFGTGLASFDHKARLHTSVTNKTQNANSVEVAPSKFTKSDVTIQQYNVESKKFDSKKVTGATTECLLNDDLNAYLKKSEQFLALACTQEYQKNIAWANVTVMSFADFMNKKSSNAFKDWTTSNIIIDSKNSKKLDTFAAEYAGNLDKISVAVQEGTFAFYVYLINDIVEESDTTFTTYDNCSGYTPKVLPYGLDMTNVTSMTIGQGVEEIEPGAFVDSKIAKFEVKNNKNFTTTDNGLFLYNEDKTYLISASTAVKGNMAVDEAVLAFYPGAIALVDSKASIYTYHDIEYGALLSRSIVSPEGPIVKTISDLKYSINELAFNNEYNTYLSLSSRGFQPYEVIVESSALTKGKIVDMLDDIKYDHPELLTGICYFDLRNSIPIDNRPISEFELPANLNNNCLIYLPNNTKLDSNQKNLVLNGKCKELNLTRDSKYGFYNIIDFTADKVIVNSAAMSKNYVNFCFPFDAETITLTNGTTTQTGNINDLLRVCYYKNYENGTLNYTINTKDKLEANHPYLINCRNAGDVKFTQMIVENTSVKATANADLNYPPSTSKSDGWFMGGTYFAAVPDAENTDYFYGMLNNVFTKATNGTTTFKPFSAFMVCTDKEKAPGNARVCLQETEMQDIVANSIEDLADASEMAVSTSNGTLSIFTTETVYVNITSVAGNKVFSGNVNGTETFEVNKGVYIVNGKKYFVK